MLWPRGLDENATPFAVVYTDSAFPVPLRHLFTTRTSGFSEVQSEDGTWVRIGSYISIGRRRTLTRVLEEQRNDVASVLVVGFERLCIAAAIDAAGGDDVVHWYEGAGTSTLCGIAYYYASTVSYGIRKTTAKLLDVTCGECRTKLINMVNAMPFLVGTASEDDA
jgi:hypothetical protein